MVLPLSPLERQLAHQVLGVTDRELGEIEQACVAQGRERLEKLKQRVRKTFKALVPKYHPDQNAGDPDKARIFTLLVRATQELYARVKSEPPAVPRAESPRRWRFHTVAVSGNSPSRATMGRPRAKRPQGLNPREQAARLGKMRP